MSARHRDCCCAPLGLFLLAASISTVQANMRAPAFGKLRWGQDKDNLYVTAYIPGVSVTDDKPEFIINTSHFSFETTNPKTAEVYRLQFEFREDVNASAVSLRHHTWKYGNQNNSLFAVIPKLEQGHLFDRLYAQKPDKKLKFAIEKDWDRYTVSDDMVEDGDDEDEDDEDGDSDEDVVKLTDTNFKKKTAGKQLVLMDIRFPWCEHCKKHEEFAKAARSKRGKRLAKKYGVLFGKVDAREQAGIRRKVSAVCNVKKENETSYTPNCGDYMHMMKADGAITSWEGSYSAAQTILSDLVKRSGESPKQLTTKAEIDALKKDSKDTVVVGLFDSSKQPKEAEAFTKVAEKYRNDHVFGIMDDAKLLGSSVEDMLEKLVGTGCVPMPAPKAPSILIIQSFTDLADDETAPMAAYGAWRSANDPSNNDDFSESSILNFIGNYKTLKIEREKTNGGRKPTDTPGGQTLVKLFVADAASNKAELKTFRCVARMLHRDATFIYHDEKHETKKPVIGGNMSDATKSALNQYGLVGKPRPLLVVDQLQGDSSIKHYALTMAKSANYLAKQIKRASAGQLPAAVRSEPEPEEISGPGRISTAVGNTLGTMLESGDVLLHLHKTSVGSHVLSLPEADKLAKALQHVGSNAKVVTFGVDRNDCNFTDPRFPTNFADVTSHCKTGKVVFVPKGGAAVAYQGVNYRAGPLLQFIHDSGAEQLDVVKGQEYVKSLDEQCTVTVHQDGARDGASTVLRVGSYDADALQEAGARNDDISSVTVSDGCQVTLYENGDMTGWNATFEPGMYDVNQMTAGGAKNDQTSSVVVSVYVPPLPPIMSIAPEASVTVEGDVTLYWNNKKPEEGVAAADTFDILSKRVKDAEGKDVADTPQLRAAGVAANQILPGEEEVSQTWMAKYTSGGLEKGATFVFYVRPVSKKRVHGEYSPASEPVLVPKEIEATEPEPEPAKDTTDQEESVKDEV